jgi:hypothetical protein
MTGNFKVNHAGAEEVLKVLARDVIDDLGRKVAEQAGEAAVLRTYTTDRAAASVSVPAGLQAKHGVLTRAASAAGLEVRPKR